MFLTFQRGDASRPRGHALLYFSGWSEPDAVFATYIIVPPIAVEITKYIPPMFASQFQAMGRAGIAVFPYPPIPERVADLALLEGLASARDDDLVSGGSVDASSPERLLQAAAEAAQQYFSNYSTYIESVAVGQASPPEEVPETSVSVDENELRFILMGEHERLEVLTKLIGQLRDAIDGGDAGAAAAADAEISQLARSMPEKYRVNETVEAARQRGAVGLRLTQLYLDRAFRLADEKYEAVASLDAEIRKLREEG